MLGLAAGFGASTALQRGQRREQQGGEENECVFHGLDALVVSAGEDALRIPDLLLPASSIHNANGAVGRPSALNKVGVKTRASRNEWREVLSLQALVSVAVLPAKVA